MLDTWAWSNWQEVPACCTGPVPKYGHTAVALDDATVAVFGGFVYGGYQVGAGCRVSRGGEEGSALCPDSPRQTTTLTSSSPAGCVSFTDVDDLLLSRPSRTHRATSTT